MEMGGRAVRGSATTQSQWGCLLTHLETDSINLLRVTRSLGIHGRHGDEVVLARRQAAHMEPRYRLLQRGQQSLRRGCVHPRHEMLRQPPVVAWRAAHLQGAHCQVHQHAVCYSFRRSCEIKVNDDIVTTRRQGSCRMTSITAFFAQMV